ncbi:Enoyl-CoA delta isomerase 1, peroxisomal [Trichoplax sp. H2]|uniref:Uncharacterized protein n=1 Tax=Trichoplax adhaerens TaxID=10228 RepID=B3SBF9_TRIAD|nr:hypothetical protein TRIADDRAFT_61604 [Trichoplax adhaerens]EDV19995.1 hypothetical protein TRIADDRAFT_61604 [Trichoplax adhaerens]RDD37566.1 Enoyl-CoA delta isomerase 1, peroxisomal [Trichoplax sp. H2]|eukprot:XP_002117585.1 hypothetical protein TRIADDRAFT_61604 [Trichoplax adhaerens]
MDGKIVQVIYQDRFAIIKMNAGENRFNLSFTQAMNRALDEIEARSDIQAVITTSTGKFFSNGLDLDWLNKQSESTRQKSLYESGVLIGRILTFPIPTVAAINGHAFAAGAILALAHDYRVMRTNHGWWSLNEVFINRRFAPGWLQVLKDKLSHDGVLRQAMLFGKRFTAEEAVKDNIIDECVAHEILMQSAKKLIHQLGENKQYPRATLGLFKRDLYAKAYNLLNESPKSKL